MNTNKMKKVVGILLVAGFSLSTFGQVQEAIQLALNIQKLNQLRQILQNMYEGYEILTNGYNKVKDITEGNFKLHELFLDGLMKVNPNVKNYKKVADIIMMQKQIIVEYKTAFEQFRNSKMYSINEIAYMARVYENLVDRTLQSLDGLLVIITAGNLRMSDGERLTIIDGIYEQVLEQITFLRSFNKQASIFGIQRAKESSDVQTMKMLYELSK